MLGRHSMDHGAGDVYAYQVADEIHWGVNGKYENTHRGIK